jgi:hypothetical protein
MLVLLVVGLSKRWCAKRPTRDEAYDFYFIVILGKTHCFPGRKYSDCVVELEGLDDSDEYTSRRPGLQCACLGVGVGRVKIYTARGVHTYMLFRFCWFYGPQRAL